MRLYKVTQMTDISLYVSIFNINLTIQKNQQLNISKNIILRKNPHKKVINKLS